MDLQHLRAIFALLPSLAGVEWAYNLRQIQRIISNSVEDEILKSVDDVEQFLAQRRHGAGRRVRCLAPPDGFGCYSNTQTTALRNVWRASIESRAKRRVVEHRWRIGEGGVVVADAGFVGTRGS